MKPVIKERLDWKQIQDEAKFYDLNPLLVAAIIAQESGGDNYAVRVEPNYKYTLPADDFAKLNGQTKTTEICMQKCSFGLMQVMGATARGLGFTGSLLELVDPEVNLEYGCKLLRKLSDRYPELSAVISSYNKGNSKRLPDGSFENQVYVNSVLNYMKSFS